jgi:hypothetical protein
MMTQDVVRTASRATALPNLSAAEPKAARRVLEFFTANIGNPNTRRAYILRLMQLAKWRALGGTVTTATC